MTAIASGGNGNWSSTTNNAPWAGGVVPIEGDKVTITHAVTLDGVYTAGDDSTTAVNINANGSLIASRVVTCGLTVKGEMVVADNGTLDLGTIASHIPQGYTCTLLLNKSAAMANGKYGLTVANGAICHMHGVVRTRNTRLTTAVTTSDSTISVDAATGWQPGDLIFIGPTERNVATATRSDFMTIHASYTPGSTTVPLTATVTYPHLATVAVSNITSNVRVANYDATNASRGYVIQTWGSLNSASERTLRHVWFDNVGSGTTNAKSGGLSITSTGVVYNTPAVWYEVQGVSIYQSTATSFGLNLNGNAGMAISFNGCVFIATGNTGGSGIAVYLPSTNYASFTSCVLAGSGVVASSGFPDGSVGIQWTTCDFIPMSGSASIGTSCLKSTATNCRFYGRGYPVRTAMQSGLSLESCDIGYTIPLYIADSGALAPIVATTTSNLSDVLWKNCLLISDIGFPSYDPSAVGWDDGVSISKLRIQNKNTNPTLQLLYTMGGEISRDNTTYYRSPSSLKLTPKINNRVITQIISVTAPNGVAITIVGYIRFNAAWATTPPSVVLSGLGIAPQTYTAVTADGWEKFTFTATQTSGNDGQLSLTFSGSTANANSATCEAFLSGVVHEDFVTDTRHYGYVYDGNTTRTADTKISQLTEATIAAYTTIETVDKLYDTLQLWAANNPTVAIPWAASGNSLILGAANLVVDASAGAAFAYATGTITIKANTLAAGTAFTGIENLGNATISNGAAISCAVKMTGSTLAVGDIDKATGVVQLVSASTMTTTAPGTAPAGSSDATSTVKVITATTGDVWNFAAWTFATGSNFENTSGANITLRIDPGDQAPDFIQTSGTITLDNSAFVNVSAPNLINGTRVRLYNVTAAAEIDNDVVAGGSGYALDIVAGVDYTPGDVLTLLATYQIAGVAKQVWRASATSGVADIVFSDAQVAWTEPTTLGIDGSTVSECATDYVEIQVEVNDGDDSTTKSRIAAFIVNALTAADGIRNWVSLAGVPAIRFPNSAMATIDTTVASVAVINVKAASKLYVDDSFAISWSNGIEEIDAVVGSSIIWSNPAAVYEIETGVSGLTAPESAKLMGLNTTNLDVTVSSRLATSGYTAPNNTAIGEIKAKTDPIAYTVAGLLDVNIQAVNDITVNGTGTNANPWNPA